MSAPDLGNAAIRFHTSAIRREDGRLMGLHSANEGFIRAFARHGGLDLFHCLVEGREHAEEFTRLVKAERPAAKVHAIDGRLLRGLADPGCVSWMDPSIARVLWRRRALGPRLFSVCGLTHTISSANSMEGLAQLLLSPMQPWDALVCTSDAVRRSVEAQRLALQDYLGVRLGAAEVKPINIAVIPLGVDCQRLKRDDKARRDWRAKLKIGEDDVVALFVGRLSFHAKANPYAMYVALQRAQGATGRRVHLIQAGWFANPDIEKSFRDGAREHAPDVTAHFLDGREPAVRGGIWSAGDLFVSLVDNVQETFGLAPIEAMAAGLPAVVSDWNGYKDTVRDGVDGFRIRTVMPPEGGGEDLAQRFFAGLDTYDHFIGGVSQAIAVDIDAAAAALERLVGDAALRLRMGEEGRRRALETFDWSVVIRQHRALWAELAAIRGTAPDAVPLGAGTANPWLMDPFAMFANYASEHLSDTTRIALVDGAGARVGPTLRSKLAGHCAYALPTPQELGAMAALLAKGPSDVGALLAAGAPERRVALRRGVAWLLKYGLARLA
ncbi:MAG: glycosyltransferase family 4 protein [Alphaproteobacteria bacterium]|nr:glycosyltransferase family 4 protein [Alphaproteobacteria bacterium]